jgi:hypothetical protein
VCPIDTTEFERETLHSRILLRLRPDSANQEERIISIRADGREPTGQMAHVSRFRWLCWAGGVLLDPHHPHQPGEATWLHAVAGGATQASDIIARSAAAARGFARSDRTPPSPPPLSRPLSWWQERRTAFAQLSARFGTPAFHGAELHLTVGVRYSTSGVEEDQEYVRHVASLGLRFGGSNRRVTRISPPTGSLWGEDAAVEEFTRLCESACTLLPAELRTGLGPTVFPPLGCWLQANAGDPTWWQWANMMWLLCPSMFTLHQRVPYREFGDRPPQPGRAPFATAVGGAELIAAAACNRVAVSESGNQLVREVRTALAARNPWLDGSDRQAASLAIDAVYHPQGATSPSGVRLSNQPSKPVAPIDVVAAELRRLEKDGIIKPNAIIDYMKEPEGHNLRQAVDQAKTIKPTQKRSGKAVTDLSIIKAAKQRNRLRNATS